MDQTQQLDDRITPFIPGQLWTGPGQSSIEDDPNCTPGSVSKPLLTETIDPETILTSLSRNSHWSNPLTDNSFLGLTSSGSVSNNMIGGMNQLNNNQNRPGRGGNNNNNSTWSSNSTNNNGNIGYNTQLSLQNQSLMTNSSTNNNNGGSIGEQLWGIGSRSSSRMGVNAPNNLAAPNASSSANLNRNSASFNNNPLLNQLQQQQQQQQQQQFYRSNSWNVPQQQQQQQHQLNPNQNNNNNQDGRSSASLNNNFPVNSGHFILIRNVSAQIDQTTLKQLCAQHASSQLTYYRYIPQMTCVIVRYNTKEEANNAQNKLNSVSLGNTTIFTQPLNENDLKYEYCFNSLILSIYFWLI